MSPNRRFPAIVVVALLCAVACNDGIRPDEARYLGPLITADTGFEGDNPALTRVGPRAWTLRILTGGACPFVRSEAEVVRRERVAIVFPYEIRKLCPERPLRSGLHEVHLAFDGDGPWSIYVMGEGGVQWADTVAVGEGQ